MPPGMDGVLLGLSKEGYVSIAQNAMVHYTNAWIDAGGQKQYAVLQAEPKEEGRNLGTVCHDANLQFLCAMEDSRWAEVCLSNTWNHRVYGYLKWDELVFGAIQDHPYDADAFPKARVQVPEGAEGLSFRQQPSVATPGEYDLKQGQEVSIHATVNEFSLVSDGNCLGYVLTQCLQSF